MIPFNEVSQVLNRLKDGGWVEAEPSGWTWFFHKKNRVCAIDWQAETILFRRK